VTGHEDGKIVLKRGTSLLGSYSDRLISVSDEKKKKLLLTIENECEIGKPRIKGRLREIATSEGNSSKGNR